MHQVVRKDLGEVLTAEENQRLTAVGPGTPMGGLMRRYWHPVAAASQLAEQPVRPVRLLGESMVLFRDGQGRLGLLAEACAHRGTSLAYGTLEDEGLRCLAHGWLYDTDGSCLEQPLEPPPSVADASVATRAYPVQELGGLIFAYLGPRPVPFLPRYDVLVWAGVDRETNGSMVSCNWLQSMENLLDPMHVESLHGRYFADVLERKGGEQLQEFLAYHAPTPMKKIGFDVFDRGIIERHVCRTEADQSWMVGTPSFFPTTSLVHSSDKNGVVIFIVPVDNTHTWFLMQGASPTANPRGSAGANAFYDVPGTDSSGNFIRDTANGQDHMVVVTQGEVAQRQSEHLGMSDVGIFLYRKLLMEQLSRVERGDDPINVCRDPERNRIVEIPLLKQRPGTAGPASTGRQRKRERTERRRTLQTLQAPSASETPLRAHQEVLIRS